MKSVSPKELIARRVAQELKDGDYVNLGIGIPTLVTNYLPADKDIVFHTENGMLGMGAIASLEEEDADLVNAGKVPVIEAKGASYFSSADSFAMIRGGHIDVAVLGCMEVDSEGNLANWMVPGKAVKGMGGAMDLANGAKKVIVAMHHCVKGQCKVLNKCLLPLTAQKVVNLIITDMAVIEVTKEGLVLKEYAPNLSVEEVVKATTADLIVCPNVREMKL